MTLLNRQDEQNQTTGQPTIDASSVPKISSNQQNVEALQNGSNTPVPGSGNSDGTVPQFAINDDGTINFGAVQQVGGQQPIVSPQSRPVLPQQIEEALGNPIPVFPSINPEVVYAPGQIPTPTQLYSGAPSSQITNNAFRRVAPRPDNNPIETAIFPQTYRQTPRELAEERGLSWLQRLTGVANSVTGMFTGLGFGAPTVSILNNFNFGEYGSGALGAVFYGLDALTNIPRGALLDVNRLNAAIINRFRQGDSFSDTYEYTDPTPNNGQLDSFFMSALRGDDQSLFNFQRDENGNYNPLGLLGENATDFYTEIAEYQDWLEHREAPQLTNNPLLNVFRDTTFSLNSLWRSPTVQRLPGAVGILLLDALTSTDGMILGAIGRRAMREAAQEAATAPIPVRGGDIVRYNPPPGATRVSPTPVTQPIRIGRRLRQQIANGADLDSALEVVRRQQLGTDIENTIRGIQANRGTTFNTPEFVFITPPPDAPPQTIRALLPPPSFSDAGRAPILGERGVPVVRTPTERATIINSQINVVPPNLTHSQIDRVIEVLPPALSNEVGLVSRTIGPRPGRIRPIGGRGIPTPESRTGLNIRGVEVPNIVPDVGVSTNPLDGITIRRTSENTVEFDYFTHSIRIGELNKARAYLNGLMDSGLRVVVNLDPNDLPQVIRYRRNLLVQNGFVTTDSNPNRLVWNPQEVAVRAVDDLPEAIVDETSTGIRGIRPRRNPRNVMEDLASRAVNRRRRQFNIVEALADNTGRPRGEYTDRVVQEYSAVVDMSEPRYRPLTDLPVNTLDEQTDFIYRESYPFGRVNRTTERSFIIQFDEANLVDRRTGDYLGMRARQRNALRQVIRTAPDDAIITVEPHIFRNLTRDLLQDGFIIRRIEDGALASIDTYSDDLGRLANDPLAEPLYEVVFSKDRTQLGNIRNVRDLPSGRSVIEGIQRDLIGDAPLPKVDTGESLQELFEQADNITNRQSTRDRVQELLQRARQEIEEPEVPASIVPEESVENLGQQVDETVSESAIPEDSVESLIRQADEIVPPEAPVQTADELLQRSSSAESLLQQSDFNPLELTDNQLQDIFDNPPDVLSDEMYDTVEQARRVGTAGVWRRESPGNYRSNAFDTDEWVLYGNESGHRAPAYSLNITREDNGRWFLSGEDHDHDVMISTLMERTEEYRNGFRTLNEAKQYGDEFGEDFSRMFYDNYPEVERYRQSVQELYRRRIEGVFNQAVEDAPPITLEAEYIDDLLNPDIVNNPDAYREVAMTLSEDIAPTTYQPSPEQLEGIQRFLRYRDEVVSHMSIDSSLRRQIQEIEDIDAEAFYDELMSYDEVPKKPEDYAEFLDEGNAEYEVLLGTYNRMLDEPSSRNVQRYLSQLEYTVRAQADENYETASRYMDLMFTEEAALRELEDEGFQRYLDDLFAESEETRRALEEQLGGSSRKRCI